MFKLILKLFAKEMLVDWQILPKFLHLQIPHPYLPSQVFNIAFLLATKKPGGQLLVKVFDKKKLKVTLLLIRKII